MVREARRRKPSEFDDAVSPYSTGIMRSGVSIPDAEAGLLATLRPELLTLSSRAVSDLTSQLASGLLRRQMTVSSASRSQRERARLSEKERE